MNLRLVNAEFLKLRKRRGLVISGLVLTTVPMVIAYATLVVLHANNPAKYGPAGGMENFVGSMEILTMLSAVAAILVGSTLGTGDLGAGVFRELVVTGRSRLALFAARVPAGLGLLVVIVGSAFAITALGSTVFAGFEGPRTEQVAPGSWETTLGFLAPSGTLLLQAAGWLALSTAVAMVLALGVASLVGSRGTSIGILLGWWIVAMPILQAMGVLGPLRQGFVGTAIDRIGPEALVPSDPAVSMSLLVAIVVLFGWAAVPLGVGAWRTVTRDA
jgi:ABC-2 family transporter